MEDDDTEWAPWTSWMWHDRVAVSFGYPRSGWILLAITTPVFNQHVVVHCSDVWSPFIDLFEWLERLADHQLPAEFSIDEEGSIVTFTALASDIVPDEVELVIRRFEVAKPLVRCRTDRLQLVREFIRRFEQWVTEDYNPREFGYLDPEAYGDIPGFDLEQGDLRRIDLSALKAKLSAGVAAP